MHDRRSWVLCFAVLLATWLLRTTPAAAGPTSPDDGCLNETVCRGHYEQAVKLFESGRFEAALPQFQAAYQRRQMPWLLLNIGRTLHRLGRPKQALEYYDRFRQAESKPDAETLARVDKYSAQARALVDGTTKDPTAVPADDDGPSATAPSATPDPPATAKPPAEPPAVTAPPAPPPPATPEPAKAEAKPVYKKWWFWTIIGGGVAAIAVTAIVAGTVAQSSPGLPSGVPTIMFKL